MSNNNLDNFQKQAAEEEFLRLAALEIESEQNDLFLEAQDLPDPPDEVLQNIQANLLKTMHKEKKQQQHRRIFLRLGRFSACAAVICCIVVSGLYFSVDAARLSINNFVMELFDGHAVVRTEVSEAQSGAPLPGGWTGPFSVNWVPARFTQVRAKDLQTSWKLLYSSDIENQYLSVGVWDSAYALNINTEGMTLVSEEIIQETPANIYTDSSEKTNTLIWVKNDCVIKIGGTISTDEAKKIAENFSF